MTGRDGTELVVHARSRRARRLVLTFAAVVAVYLVVLIVWDASWRNAAVPALILVGQLMLVATTRQWVALDERGVTVDELVRRRRVAWSDIDTIRVHWRPVDGSHRFEVIRIDGSSQQVRVLADLASPSRRDERQVLLDRLGTEADRQRFTLDVREPAHPRG